ncbi:MAG TPA: zinc ribbon domain-containing protein [Blastocatellia bacterium]|nr:zinc ribbon domain-containing protein [Blastocatellia bacterium]
MQCPNCGAAASPGAQFCPGCGASFLAYQQTVASTSQSFGPMGYGAAPVPAPRAASRAPVITSVVLAVLLVGVSVALVISLLSGKGFGGTGAKSAIKSGMGPGETVKTVYKTSTSLYDKLVDGSFDKGDFEVAYDTLVDVLPVDKIRDRAKQEIKKADFRIPSLEVVSEDINGDRATVRIRTTERGLDREGEVAMIKEGGKWKFDVMKDWR